MIELTDTDSSQIAATILSDRRKHGSPAMGMVMTLVVVSDEEQVEAAMASAREATHEHPARVLGVIHGSPDGAAQVDAQVGVGDSWSGEAALIRLHGPVVDHAASVVLPLLLPDSPVVVWWAGRPPADPGTDPLGSLAQRRITDAAQSSSGSGSLLTQCRDYAPGSTDLAWTRLTAWRALLAASLDQHRDRVTGAAVASEAASPSADLLAAWLHARLGVEVSRSTTEGPGLTEVSLQTASGEVRISRQDGRLATLAVPGQPDRPVALKRRTVAECLTEELRHLDEDDVYAETARTLVGMTA